MKILVTGGAGFIGSALIRHLLTKTSHHVVNVDKLTYAADLTSLEPFADHPGYRFERVDICDEPAIRRLYAEHDPDTVMHLAAETHVDRSIEGPDAFIRTNVMGTFSMLNGALEHWHRLSPERRAAFRFHHISTDEVYGSLGEEGRFTETTPYDPRSPYSASKAASDHLVSAWYHTHGLPILITNCSNNYGPYQFPEKLIPLMITKALAGQPLPVYGKGNNVRDWLYVDDHVKALIAVVEKGAIGGCYNVGGDGERTNLQVVESLCDLLDKLVPNAAIGSHRNLISFVADRPGHDFRYAMDPTKIREELGWVPEETFETGLEKTVHWYLDHRSWWQAAQSRGGYTGERLGLRATG